MTSKRSNSSSAGRIVIFDMDGTLIRSLLDFDLLRSEIGLGHGPILEAVRKMPHSQRVRAEEILDRHEERAAAASELLPGADDVLATIRNTGIPIALMTRNSATSVATFQSRHKIEFDLVWTREDGPMKPSPEPVLEICRRLGADPKDAVVVGDFHYDILCGSAAGSTTVLMLAEPEPRPDWADETDYVIHQLAELLPLLGIDSAHD